MLLSVLFDCPMYCSQVIDFMCDNNTYDKTQNSGSDITDNADNKTAAEYLVEIPH